MQAIGEVITSLERLTRLNRSLLLLARIENRQFPDERSIVFGPLMQEVVEEFGDLAGHCGVSLDLRVDAAFEHTMDPGLARSLANNLVKNAIVHNVRGGSVQVQVDTSGITVRNSGAEKPLDPALIFNRFHKETTADGGTGLGLAIAKAIAEMYGLRLSYAYEGAHVMRLNRA